MRKFLTVIGNRPQLIKYDKEFKQVMIYTGQHYDKLLKDVFFEGLEIPKPDYDLSETDLGAMIDRIMIIIDHERPDYVIVYGDTRSTLAGALAAYYKNIPVIHIEAGCRSFNDKMIEERIRKMVDEIAIIHFAPSQKCKEYLELDDKKMDVYNVGATQIDAMFQTFPTIKPKDAYEYYVATIHREENVTKKENLENILKAFAESNKNIELYLHPRTKLALEKFNLELPRNVIAKQPLGYRDMIHRVAFAEKIITDSGGLQVEAFFLRRPCVTLRNETEWTETVDTNWNILTGTNVNKIVEAINAKMYGHGENLIYGNGGARKKIRLILENL
jgi:UDP-GlcNAc3NAcA epimerase